MADVPKGLAVRFCLLCGSPAEVRVPDGDNLPRYQCTACEHIHYQNPLVVTGAAPEFEGRILLCKRAIEPRRGYWTLPAGFMELGETVADGARRETWEEARAEVEIGELYAVVDVPHAGQVHMFYRATLSAPEFAAGPESLEVELFAPEDIPWDEISFPSVRTALKQWIALSDGQSEGLLTTVAERM